MPGEPYLRKSPANQASCAREEGPDAPAHFNLRDNYLRAQGLPYKFLRYASHGKRTRIIPGPMHKAVQNLSSLDGSANKPRRQSLRSLDTRTQDLWAHSVA